MTIRMPTFRNYLEKGVRGIQFRVWVLLLGLMILGAGSASAQIDVGLPDTSGVAGETALIPVEVDDLTGEGVLSFEFAVTYDVDTLSVTGIETSGTIASDLTVVANTDSAGKVTVSGAGTQELSGSGTLVQLKVKYKGAGTSPLELDNFQFNEGSPSANLSGGTVTVDPPLPGDITVRLPKNKKEVGDTSTVPITVSDTDGPNGEGVLSFDFAFSYDESLITVDTVFSSGTLTEDWTVEGNTTVPGEVSVSAGNTETLRGQDSVLVQFRVIYENEGEGSLTWQRFQFNEGDPTSELVNGAVDIAGKGTIPPAVPTGLNAEGRDGEIYLTWGENIESDLAGYNIYRSTDSLSDVSGMTPINGSTVVQDTSYTDQKVSRGTSYHYQVTAVDADANESGPSDPVGATPTFGWPTPSDTPALVFKVETTSSSSVKKVVVTRKSGDRTGNILSEKTLDGSFVVFDSTDLGELNVEGVSTARINLYDADGQILGHQEFEYDSEFYSRGKSLDAILHVHGESILQPLLSRRTPEWTYYQEGESPVSMLIPPNRQIEEVGEESPLLMVHGISGIYPYWGYDPFQPNPNGEPSLVSELSNQYDTWRFYYPKNQDVTKSSPLLSKVLRSLQQNYYSTEEKIDVVAHSMGGLVTRHYIQSDSEDGGIGPRRRAYPDSLRYSQNQNIGKLIMMGTPNHGARSAYIPSSFTADGWIIETANGKDVDAPSYDQLTPGSKFLWDLNSIEETSGLTKRDMYPKAKTLVLAGTLNPVRNSDPTSTLVEIPNQDDGLVAVSSATLLDEGIPLATGEFTHSSALDRDNGYISGDYDPRLPTETAPVVTSFLDSSYDPSSPSLGDDVTGFWRSEGSALVGPPEINRKEGVLILNLPGVTVDGFSISECSGSYQSCKPGELHFDKRGRSLRKVPEESRYFSAGIRLSNVFLPSEEFVAPGIGLAVSEGIHPVTLRKVVPDIGSRNFGQFSLDFDHLRTNRKSIQLSEAEQRIANANGFVPANSPSSSSKIAKATPSDESEKTEAIENLEESSFPVTASTDTLSFWLAQDSTGSFSGHNMRLVSPNGIIIDSTDAKSRSRFAFSQNLESGFALYSVVEPSAGNWRVRHNTSAPATVVAPVMSAVDLTVSAPDSAFTTGEEVPVTVSFSDNTAYESVDVSSRLSVRTVGDSTTVTNLGTLSLSEHTATSYEGTFSPAYRGTYRVTVDFSAGVDSNSVLRRAVETVVVTGDSTETAPEPPSPPSGLLAQVERAGTIGLNWSSSNSGTVSEYHVYRDTIPAPSKRVGIVSSESTTYSDTSLDAGHTYYYRVAAASSNGVESELSEEAEARLSDPPNPPSGLEAVPSPDSIKISWTAPEREGVASYRIYRDTNSDGLSTGSFYDSVDSGVTSYIDTEVRAGGKYDYRVAAVDTLEREGALSKPVSVYLNPSTVVAEVARSFGAATGPGDYRLVALPGAANNPLDETVSGEAGSEWQAYWDDGSDFVRYDGSGTFTFQKGRGFWLTSRQDWTVTDSIRAASLKDSTTAIPLNDGWTIIANPFGRDVSWNALQSVNNGDLQALWPFEGAFDDTSRTFASAASGKAYYLFNDSGRDSLEVPHPALTKTSKALGLKETSVEEFNLALSAAPADSDELSSTVKVGLTEAEKSEETLVAPPGGLEAVSLRVVADTADSVSAQTRLLMTSQRHPVGEGEVFRIRLTSRVDGPVELKVWKMQSMGGQSVAMLDPMVGQTYDLTRTKSVRIDPEAGERTLRLAIGTESYVEDRQQEVLPSEVRLTSYPNPVHKQGTIEYALPDEKEVTLRVYDVLGREVASLASGKKRAGRHTVRLSTDQLSSGVYFGRLQAGGQTRTLKITVVR